MKEVVARLSNNGAGKGLNGSPLEIHASTQQTVTCADGVSFAAERTNATRVVSCFLLLFVYVLFISQNFAFLRIINEGAWKGVKPVRDSGNLQKYFHRN